MENKRAIVISLICFLISMLLITAYTRVRHHELTAEFGEEVDVVVANTFIPEYGLIRPEMLTTTRVFKNFRQPDTVTSFEELVGKSTYVPIYKDEQITLTKLINQDGKPVLDRQVEKKMRAVTLPLDPAHGVSKLIRPGNRIDIITNVNYDQDGATIFEVKTVLQNVLVLATGKNIQNQVPTRVNRDVMNYLEEKFQELKRKDFSTATVENLATGRPDDNYSNITIQLTPEEAEKILFLSHLVGEGRLYFTLRNGADQEVAKIDTTLLDEVLGPESDYGFSKRKPPPAPPPKPPKFIDSLGGVPKEIY